MATQGKHASTRSTPDPEPRWLTPEQRVAWLSLSRLIVKLPSALDGQLQRDAGLSYFEYMVLAMLSEQPDLRLRMSTLAAITSASLSRLSHVAKRLELQGFLHREHDPEDGRYTYAILTPSGMAKVVDTAPGHVEAVREMVIDSLTVTQLRRMRTAHDLLLDRVDPDGNWPPTTPTLQFN